jgi:superfamily II DNA or RNA helicase
MTLTLRPYQEQALQAEDAHRAERPEENRLLIEMATGLGKSITLAERARRFLDSFEGAGNRVLIIVHTDELVHQLAVDAAFMAESANTDDAFYSVGIVKGPRNDVDADIVVASVATLIQPGRLEQITDVGYLIIDEAHHAVADSYVKIMRHVGGMAIHKYDDGEKIPVLGMTATPMRSDGQGLGNVWHDLVFSRNLIWGIRHGYLIDIVPYSIRVPGGVDTMADSLAPEVVVDAWREKVATPALETASPPGGWGSDPAWHLPSTILFAPLVKDAQGYAEAFSMAGVKAEVVSDKMPKAEVRAVLDRFKAGTTTVVCNAMMLTEGVNIPRIMCVIWARPVRKEGSPLLTQGVGRGTRPWLSAEAPPREDQKCILLVVTPDSAIPLAGVADLSEHAAEGRDGVSLLTMEDQWDLGKDLPDETVAYAGPVDVQRWDAAVQASTRAWKYTKAGTPFLPTAKRGQGYVFIVERDDEWGVWHRRPEKGRYLTTLAGRWAPDLELAMSVAEDLVQELGGSIGTLLADRGRAWRQQVPKPELQELAMRLGLSAEVKKIMASRAAGKAGKLSDVVDIVQASKVLDPTAEKIKTKATTR